MYVSRPILFCCCFIRVGKCCYDLGYLDCNNQVSVCKPAKNTFWEVRPQYRRASPWGCLGVGCCSVQPTLPYFQDFADILDVYIRKWEFKSHVSSASLETWGKSVFAKWRQEEFGREGKLLFSSFRKYDNNSKLGAPE